MRYRIIGMEMDIILDGFNNTTIDEIRADLAPFISKSTNSIDTSIQIQVQDGTLIAESEKSNTGNHLPHRMVAKKRYSDTVLLGVPGKPIIGLMMSDSFLVRNLAVRLVSERTDMLSYRRASESDIALSIRNALIRDSRRNTIDTNRTHQQMATSLYFFVDDSLPSIRTAILSSLVLLGTQRGLILLHGATVVWDRHAFVLVGPSGAGKSTASILFKEAKKKVLGDEFCCVGPGWPDRALQVLSVPFNGIVTDGTIQTSTPLGAIILLDRTAPRGINRLDRSESRINILKNLVWIDGEREFYRKILDLAQRTASHTISHRLSYRLDHTTNSELFTYLSSIKR